MNQNTKMVLGLLAVGAVAYYLWDKTKKDVAKVASTPTPVNPPVRVLPVDPIVPIETAPVNQTPLLYNMDGNFNAMTPIFKDYAGDPAGFFSSEKVKLNY
jgi:hypothetical protein